MSEGVTPSPKGAGFPVRTHNWTGGASVTALGVALLVYALFTANTTIPRFMASCVALIGLATLVGIIPVQSPRDYYGGLALVMLTILALIASADLPGQRGFAFGPGTAPRLFSFVLAAVAAVVALGGVFAEGPPIEKYKVRGPTLVILAIFCFGVMIRPLGLVPASFVSFMISTLGSSEARWVESLLGAAAMTVFCVLLFVYLLGLPFQLWPRF